MKEPENKGGTMTVLHKDNTVWIKVSNWCYCVELVYLGYNNNKSALTHSVPQQLRSEGKKGNLLFTS